MYMYTILYNIIYICHSYLIGFVSRYAMLLSAFQSHSIFSQSRFMNNLRQTDFGLRIWHLKRSAPWGFRVQVGRCFFSQNEEKKPKQHE